jgi:hypothetical protein
LISAAIIDYRDFLREHFIETEDVTKGLLFGGHLETPLTQKGCWMELRSGLPKPKYSSP